LWSKRMRRCRKGASGRTAMWTSEKRIVVEIGVGGE
jgi:hypothetical protein